MKGFKDKDNKFHPIKQYQKISMSIDHKEKTQGIRLKKDSFRKEKLFDIEFIDKITGEKRQITNIDKNSFEIFEAQAKGGRNGIKITDERMGKVFLDGEIKWKASKIQTIIFIQ